jgi:hypothetical protein
MRLHRVLRTALIAGALVPSFLGSSTAATPATETAPGTILLRIELSIGTNAGTPSVDPKTLRVVTVRTDGDVAVGTTRLGPERKNSDGSHFVEMYIGKLPVDVSISISVEVVPPPGATPMPTGFLNLLRFRPKGAGFGGDTFVVNLDAAHPAHPGIVDFVPYYLEVPPLPPQPTAT